MKILTIDIGNSNICIGCVNNHKVEFVERMQSDRKKTDLEFAVLVKMVLELHNVDISSLHGAIISSVVPPLTDIIRQAVMKLTGISSMIVGPGMKTGINVLPQGVGADLVVGAVAAIQFYSAPAIIIDMGTATTVTVINKNKDFIGGAIYPGVAIALQSLESGTAQLPHIQLKQPKKVINMDTISSMQSGVIYGNAGAMDALIERMMDELGYSVTIIATGGLAPLIVPHCKYDIVIDDELLLKGLDTLFYKNYKSE
ncbi:MAG: type III pantothenate kinase [Oscillospiraceae bacterium]|nr:type III pantothenate kinase [Oscillospiraceae bacterium]